jgi:hypothetical protein
MNQKISLADAIKQKLAQKKEAQASGKNQKQHGPSGNEQMKSQISKKPSAIKRRAGGG